MTDLPDNHPDSSQINPEGIAPGAPRAGTPSQGASKAWADRILEEFPAELARLWIVSDPDDVLLDEKILPRLRERGFKVLPFEDSIAFRAEYEQRFRCAWDRGESGPYAALILHLRDTRVDELPWDYLRQGHRVSLSLGTLFPRLSYPVVRLLDSTMRPALFEAQAHHARQDLGEIATKEFVLTHLFGISPHLVKSPPALWRELLRLHFGEAALPQVLAQYLGEVIGRHPGFEGLPVTEWFANKATALRVVQNAWYRHLNRLGITGTHGQTPQPDDTIETDVPFGHADVRAIIDSMFLDGTLHPLVVQSMPASLPEWVKIGVLQDPAALRNLVAAGIRSLRDRLPGGTPAENPSYRDWTLFARRLGEVISRFHALDTAQAEDTQDALQELRRTTDARLRDWVRDHYPDLISLSPAKGPIMVHHVPWYLAGRRRNGEKKMALLVFDGLAVDQWVQIRDIVTERSPRLAFEENACFAWAPTLTSISRQALFAGERPRHFADSIRTTDREHRRWSDFWSSQGVQPGEVLYHRGLDTTEQLPGLRRELADSRLKIAGIVVNTVDDMMHGAVLGKRGMASQIASWCESGFVDRLLTMLLDGGFHVYLTADHGNVDAVGIGTLNQGVAAETRGERVRIYDSEQLRSEATASVGSTFCMDIPGLPSDFLSLFADGHGAFVREHERIVAHGGMSVEELIVPFVKVRAHDDPGPRD